MKSMFRCPVGLGFQKRGAGLKAGESCRLEGSGQGTCGGAPLPGRAAGRGPARPPRVLPRAPRGSSAPRGGGGGGTCGRARRRRGRPGPGGGARPRAQGRRRPRPHCYFTAPQRRAPLPLASMSLTAESHRVALSDGNSIPLLGLGTYSEPKQVSAGPLLPPGCSWQRPGAPARGTARLCCQGGIWARRLRVLAARPIPRGRRARGHATCALRVENVPGRTAAPSKRLRFGGALGEGLGPCCRPAEALSKGTLLQQSPRFLHPDCCGSQGVRPAGAEQR